jgi:hypothetical protein
VLIVQGSKVWTTTDRDRQYELTVGINTGIALTTIVRCPYIYFLFIFRLRSEIFLCDFNVAPFSFFENREILHGNFIIFASYGFSFTLFPF